MMSQCGLGLGGGRSLAGSHGMFLDAWGELLGIGVQAAGHLKERRRKSVIVISVKKIKKQPPLLDR